MIEKLYPLDLKPGLVNNGTKSQSQNRWYTGNLARFYQGTIRPVGGWVKRTLTGATINAVPRGAVSWTTPTGTGIIVCGGGSGLYQISGSVVTDLTPAIIAAAPGTDYYYQLTTFGTYLIGVYGFTRLLVFWDPSVGGIALKGQTQWPSGPASANAVVTTPERFLVVLGDTTGQHLRWPSQQTVTDWTPSAINTAGDFTLETQGMLVCGQKTRGQTLLWTTTDVWTMTYIGGDLIYSFARVGDNCGIVGIFAAVVLDTKAYWMGYGQFFSFDGYVKPIACEVSDYVFGSLNLTYAFKIWTLANPQYGEITWFYPSGSSIEVDRYVTYNYQEEHWSFGTLVRTTGVTRQAGATSPVPVMFGADGSVYDHETGDARTGQTVFLESGPMTLGDGDNVMRMQRIVPDDKTQGDVSASLYTSMYPDSAETLNGPYTLASPTSIRLTARLVRLRLTEAVATAWRVGTVRIGAIVGGRR